MSEVPGDYIPGITPEPLPFVPRPATDGPRPLGISMTDLTAKQRHQLEEIASWFGMAVSLVAKSARAGDRAAQETMSTTLGIVISETLIYAAYAEKILLDMRRAGVVPPAVADQVDRALAGTWCAVKLDPPA